MLTFVTYTNLSIGQQENVCLFILDPVEHNIASVREPNYHKVAIRSGFDLIDLVLVLWALNPIDLILVLVPNLKAAVLDMH